MIGACGRGNGLAAPFKWLRRAVKEAAEVSSENIIRTFLEFSTCDAEETASSPVKAWKRGTDWHKSLCKEAVPLPVAVVKKLEEAASQGAEDSLFLCSMLLMCWCGLRWSDLQRISLDKVSPSDGILHGSGWRAKARKRGMVWGCMSDGFLQSAWG